jgi:hypothetical protein
MTRRGCETADNDEDYDAGKTGGKERERPYLPFGIVPNTCCTCGAIVSPSPVIALGKILNPPSHQSESYSQKRNGGMECVPWTDTVYSDSVPARTISISEKKAGGEGAYGMRREESWEESVTAVSRTA